MNDLTSKILTEKYNAVLKESEHKSQLPHGFEKVTTIELETAHGHKPLKAFEIWVEGSVLKIAVDTPTPAEENKPAGPATINPSMALEEKKPDTKKPLEKPVKKSSFKKNSFINKFKDKKGSFGDLGTRLG